MEIAGFTVGESQIWDIQSSLAGSRTQDGINPFFVSVGHVTDQRGAQQIVLACAIRHRLPEPTRVAD